MLKNHHFFQAIIFVGRESKTKKGETRAILRSRKSKWEREREREWFETARNKFTN